MIKVSLHALLISSHALTLWIRSEVATVQRTVRNFILEERYLRRMVEENVNLSSLYSATPLQNGYSESSCYDP